MNIIFWCIRDKKINIITSFILKFSNFISLITKTNLEIDIPIPSSNVLEKNVNLIFNESANSLSQSIGNKNINILFLDKIIPNLKNDNILIILLDLEKIDENVLFNIFKEVKKCKYSKFLFLPFKQSNINKITETISMNFIYNNISKKNILDIIDFDIDLNNKKFEEILQKIREI